LKSATRTRTKARTRTRRRILRMMMLRKRKRKKRQGPLSLRQPRRLFAARSTARSTYLAFNLRSI